MKRMNFERQFSELVALRRESVFLVQGKFEIFDLRSLLSIMAECNQFRVKYVRLAIRKGRLIFAKIYLSQITPNSPFSPA